MRRFVHSAFAVAYFVYDLANTDTFDSAFVLGKARVAPLKQHTITKLELQAAVLGTRIANFVKRESSLPITHSLLVRQQYRHLMDPKLT